VFLQNTKFPSLVQLFIPLRKQCKLFIFANPSLISMQYFRSVLNLPSSWLYIVHLLKQQTNNPLKILSPLTNHHKRHDYNLFVVLWWSMKWVMRVHTTESMVYDVRWCEHTGSYQWVYCFFYWSHLWSTFQSR
jgi:hypothetical protein